MCFSDLGPGSWDCNCNAFIQVVDKEMAWRWGTESYIGRRGTVRLSK
jgi:hypothetical protein